MSVPVSASGPPRPRARLTVGVTGHRDLDQGEQSAIQAEAERALRALMRGWTGHELAYAPEPAELVLLSQLAAGADQALARAALVVGAALNVVLPFARGAYLASLPHDARVGFEALEAAACGVWTASEDGEDAEHGYELAGDFMLARSDVLFAVWDGRPGRGPGGTAAVVHQAVRQGVPVVHLGSAPRETRVLWSGFAEHAPWRLGPRSAPNRPGDDAVLTALTVELVQPPPALGERAALSAFFGERERRLRVRPEYPLLLTLTGVRALRRGHFVVEPYREATEREWGPFHAVLADLQPDGDARSPMLQEAFCWADRLADHYAQTYRSGTVLNYAAAAIAVLAALTGVLAPGAKVVLLALELLAICALVANTTIGNRRQWHRRWLDYRFMAEQLRPLRSLRALGGVRLEMRGGGVAPAASWTEWYVAAIWRSLPFLPGPPAADATQALAQSIAAHELDPQISYHSANAAQMHLLDERLHRAGTVLFVLSLACSLVGLCGYVADIAAVHAYGPWLTVAGAGLPTVGSALFGIRGQNDFSGVARRSASTATRLRAIAERLRAPPLSPDTAARLTEDAARAMAADLTEWRGAFLDRKLQIPA